VKNDNMDSLKIPQIIHAARVAEEMGADIVKISCPECVEDIRHIKESIHIPFVISGGNKINTVKIILQIKQAIDAGASGIAMGRNIFQSENSQLLTRIICELIHNNVSYEEAIKRTEKILGQEEMTFFSLQDKKYYEKISELESVK
jgi:DhnA family fructose-bisphosphate aldolase class Ia